MNNPYYYQPTQNGEFIPVPNEMYARNYPIAPGKSVTFKDESLPYVYYSKTMGASQFDSPVFKRYRLIEEETTENVVKEDNSMKDEIAALWSAIEELRNVPKKTTTKRKEDNGGEE